MWTLSYRLNNEAYEEIFEFLTIALLRMYQLEAKGMKVSLHQV